MKFLYHIKDSRFYYFVLLYFVFQNSQPLSFLFAISVIDGFL